MSLTLDLFAEPILEEKPIAFYEKLNAQLEAANKSIAQKLGFDPLVEGEKLREATERSRALREDLVFPSESVDKGADSFALGRLEDLNHHAYAFVAQARKHGSTDPSLTPVRVSAAGRREFDLDELARYANELLRGVRSVKPTMTLERWGEAIAKVREATSAAHGLRELGGKS